MFQKVLIPLDGSEIAEGILPYAIQLARGLGMQAVVMSVVDPDDLDFPDPVARGGTWLENTGDMSGAVILRRPPQPQEGPSYPHERGGLYNTQVIEGVQVQVARRLEQVAQRLAAEGVQARAIAAVGKPAEEIIRLADQEGCDLIAMSTHGRNLLARGILGSVTHKVVHASHLPVLTITPDRARRYWQPGTRIARVMVPLDGSALAESVLPYVEFLAQKLSLEVVLVRAVRVRPPDWASYVPDSTEARIESEATEYLKGIASSLRSKGLQVRWELLRGTPARALIEHARLMSADMIAMTTHGRSGVARWALGSVAEALVSGSGDPVLVVPARAKRQGPRG